jgi:hypothetical protein
MCGVMVLFSFVASHVLEMIAVFRSEGGSITSSVSAKRGLDFAGPEVTSKKRRKTGNRWGIVHGYLCEGDLHVKEDSDKTDWSFPSEHLKACRTLDITLLIMFFMPTLTWTLVCDVNKLIREW